MPEQDIDDVLDIIGFGRMQMIIFSSCFLQQFYISNELLSQGVVGMAANCDLGIDEQRLSIGMALVMCAQILSSHYMGYKSDIIGRRKLLLYTSALSMISSFLSAFMPTYWTYIGCRFLVGLFITGPLGALVTYLGEFTKISMRPQLNNFLCYAMGISMIYCPAMAVVITSMNFSIHIWGGYKLSSWRAIVLANILPGIISFVMLYLMPESPKFYLSDNRPEEAYEVLERCLRANKGKKSTLAELDVHTVTQPRLRRATLVTQMPCLQRVWYETRPLLRKPYLGIFALISALLFLLFAVANGLGQWLPHVRHITTKYKEHLTICDSMNLHHNANDSNDIISCTVHLSDFYDSILFGCGVLFSFVVITILLLCLHRKPVILVYAVVSAFGGFGLNFLTLNLLSLISFLLFVVPPMATMRLAVTVLIDELPTHLRGKGIAMAFMVGRIGAVVFNLYVGSVLPFSCYLVFNTFFVMVLVSIVLTCLLPKDKS